VQTARPALFRIVPLNDPAMPLLSTNRFSKIHLEFTWHRAIIALSDLRPSGRYEHRRQILEVYLPHVRLRHDVPFPLMFRCPPSGTYTDATTIVEESGNGFVTPMRVLHLTCPASPVSPSPSRLLNACTDVPRSSMPAAESSVYFSVSFHVSLRTVLS